MNYKISVFIFTYLLVSDGCTKSSPSSIIPPPTDSTISKIIWHKSGLDTLTVHALMNGIPSDIIAATDQGLFKTTDRGANWISAGLDSNEVLSLARYYPWETMYAGTSKKGVYISSDRGNTWNQCGLVGIPINSLHTLIDGTVLAGTLVNGLFRSSNKGITWQAIDTNIFLSHPIYAFYGDGPVLIGSKGIYVSDGSGKHWTLSSNELENISFHAFDKLAGITFAGTDLGGVYRADTNSTLFKLLNNNLNNTKVTSFCFGDNGHLFAGTSNHGIFRSTDWKNWTAANDSLTNLRIHSLLIDNYGYLFVGTSRGGVFRSTLLNQHF